MPIHFTFMLNPYIQTFSTASMQVKDTTKHKDVHERSKQLYSYNE